MEATKENSKKANRKRLVQIASENTQIVYEGKYGNPEVHIANYVNHTNIETKTINPDYLSVIHVFDECQNQKIDVVNEKSTERAKRLWEKYGEAPLVLNFASAKRPGGGYLNGSVAQEEDLCRVSALYYSIKNQSEFYKQYTEKREKVYSGIYSDYMIHSPKVVFFRDDDYNLLEKPYFASVLTCAAPNNSNNIFEPNILRNVLERRIDYILAYAWDCGYEHLVLGAWGCGVFGNDPKVVAGIFADLLYGKYKDCFEEVIFSVYDKTEEKNTYKSFRKEIMSL